MARVDHEAWERKRGGKIRSFIKTEARSNTGKRRSNTGKRRSTKRSCSKRERIQVIRDEIV